MRLRLECTTEPFDLDEPPEHALVARAVVGNGTLDAVDVGPFGNTAEGSAEAVVEAVAELLRRTLAAGATRVSMQVNVLTEGGAPPADTAHVPPGRDLR
ncbi:hypothetical protein ACFO3J_06145 [Streptomyces polygonati]|uniref:Thiamine-binding protein domain-containing protein n=1 Tax=Streptomyces polygonati TaxID=1617087 RepID=A0ABV8HGL2_9ACTN